MATLYVTNLPVGCPEDITFRALRILRETSLVVASDPALAGRQLRLHDIPTPIASTAEVDHVKATLGISDVSLLVDGWWCGPLAQERNLIRLALKDGHAVVSLPGPTLPCTALVVSGLPADSFVYLGRLPLDSCARRDLLTLVSTERRTLIALESAQQLLTTLEDVRDIWGSRSLALATTGDPGLHGMWRGTVEEALVRGEDWVNWGQCVVVIGGAKKGTSRWDEDRLQDRIAELVRSGLGAKEISQKLAIESGWPRREVYRCVVESSRFLRKE